MLLRPGVVGVVIREDRSYLSTDVRADPHAVGQPLGRPPIHRFLGVPLRLGHTVIGMIGMASKPGGYDPADERLLSTFAGQVAVDNARPYERQRQAIAELWQLRGQMTDAEQIQLLGREQGCSVGVLHDWIAQEIFTIGVGLNALLEGCSPDHQVAGQLRGLRRLPVKASDEVRRAIFALTGPETDGAGLTDRLRPLLTEFQQSSGIQAHLFVTGTPGSRRRCRPRRGARVVEKELTNVRNHVCARTALVSVHCEPDRLDLVVQDDGVGAPDIVLHTFPGSRLYFGLRHLRQVVTTRGGSFEVANGEEAGLVVAASLPLRSGEARCGS